MGSRFRTQIALFTFQFLYLIDHALAQTCVRSEPLIIIRDLFAQILLFDFEESFGILFLQSADKKTEESADQISESSKHRLLSCALVTLPDLQQVVYHFSLGLFTGAADVHFQAKILILHEGTAFKQNRHARVAGAKSMFQRLTLDRFREQKIEKCSRGFALFGGAPWDVENVIRVVIPNV